MQTPSIKSILTIPGVTPEQATAIRDRLVTATNDPNVWRTRAPLRAALRDVDAILGNHGVESFTGSRGSVAYSNTGDTYAPTVCLVCMDNGRDRWFIGSWGDLVERHAVGVTR